MKRLVVLAVLLGSLLLNRTAAQDKKDAVKVKVLTDVVYGKGGDEDMQLDLALPEGGRGPHATVVCIHGGGWRGGKRQDLAKLTELFAQRGFVAATVSYRLTAKAQFPAQIEDCKAAVRWLRANSAKHQIDPDRIGAVGFSAGAHLSCLLGTANKKDGLEGKGGNSEQSSRVQAVVSFFGPTDFTEKTWTKEVEDFFLVPFLGGPYEEKKDLYRKCSPIVYVNKENPPFLFFHGTKDPLVNIRESDKLAKKLTAAGVYAKLVTMENEGHGWKGDKLNQTLDQTIAFFEDKLKK